MSVIRNRHNSKQPFVLLDKKTLWNEDLSLGALGLWSRCISRPDNWHFSVKELVKRCVDSQYMIYKYFKELIKINLCIRIQHRCVLKKDGKIHMGAGPVEYIFLEVPVSAEERKAIIFEMERDFVLKLLNDGFEFHDTEKSAATRKFKKYLLHSKLSDATASDATDSPITNNYCTNEEVEQGTNAGGCSKDPDEVNKDTLREHGVDEAKFKLLRKSFTIEAISEAFELLKKTDSPVKNAYGWLKKCLEQDWVNKEKEKEKETKKSLSENIDFALKVEKASYGRLLPGSSICLQKDSLVIISGEKINEIKYIDKSFKQKVENLLKRMNINVS